MAAVFLRNSLIQAPLLTTLLCLWRAIHKSMQRFKFTRIANHSDDLHSGRILIKSFGIASLRGYDHNADIGDLAVAILLRHRARLKVLTARSI
jgi:hypothetical protein